MFSLILGILLVIAAIVAPFIVSRLEMRGGGIVSAICLLLAAVIIISSCVSTVPTGHTGILTTFGRVEDRNLPEGMNFHAPWQNITTMTNKEQIFTEKNVCFSADLQEVAYTYTVKYSLLPSSAPTIYKTVGTDYFNILIKPQVNNAIKAEFGLVEAENMTELRTQLQAKINETVKAFATQYGIEISVVIDDFDFSDAYTNAIEAKQVAEQEALRDKTQQTMETERTRQQAERAKIEAENAAAIREINATADADAARIKAQADFEVAKLEGDAIAYKGAKEAEATAALAAAITDEVVAYEYAQNWSGELPQYMIGSNGVLPIVDIPMGE
jgi:regulator of protease activity HflC (stomatin/prohibitin superfamily)